MKHLPSRCGHSCCIDFGKNDSSSSLLMATKLDSTFITVQRNALKIVCSLSTVASGDLRWNCHSHSSRCKQLEASLFHVPRVCCKLSPRAQAEQALSRVYESAPLIIHSSQCLRVHERILTSVYRIQAMFGTLHSEEALVDMCDAALELVSGDLFSSSPANECTVVQVRYLECKRGRGR